MSDWSLTITAGGKGPGCAVLVGIVVRYTRLYINDGIMGPSLIDVVLMGPPPQCSRYIWLIGVFVAFFSFEVIAVPLSRSWSVLHRPAGAQHCLLTSIAHGFFYTTCR